MAHDHHASSHDTLGHIVSKKTYATVLISLLILTFITVAASRFNFGTWNIVVAMVIASIKAGLVTLFFMHLKYENKLTWLYVLFPILLLFIMIGGIYSDNPMRVHPQPVAIQKR